MAYSPFPPHHHLSWLMFMEYVCFLHINDGDFFDDSSVGGREARWPSITRETWSLSLSLLLKSSVLLHFEQKLVFLSLLRGGGSKPSNSSLGQLSEGCVCAALLGGCTSPLHGFVTVRIKHSLIHTHSLFKNRSISLFSTIDRLWISLKSSVVPSFTQGYSYKGEVYERFSHLPWYRLFYLWH